MTIAAWVATVDRSRISSGANTPSRGSAITSVPTSTPCARSGTAAAEATSRPATQLAERALGGRHRERALLGVLRSLAVRRERHQGALRLEESHGIPDHLLDDAV